MISVNKIQKLQSEYQDDKDRHDYTNQKRKELDLVNKLQNEFDSRIVTDEEFSHIKETNKNIPLRPIKEEYTPGDSNSESDNGKGNSGQNPQSA